MMRVKNLSDFEINRIENRVHRLTVSGGHVFIKVQDILDLIETIRFKDKICKKLNDKLEELFKDDYVFNKYAAPKILKAIKDMDKNCEGIEGREMFGKSSNS